MKPELSIIIPCYNEEKNIPLLAEKFKSFPESIEIILVNNGSTDSTKKLIEKYSKKDLRIKLVNIKKNKGYGHGIYKGLKKAKGEYLSWTHADLQTNPIDVLCAYMISEKDAYIKGKRYGRSFFDNFFTWGMSVISTLFLGEVLYDINSQPNLFHKSFLKQIKKPPKDFSFDLYCYYLAKKYDYQIKRIDVFFGKRIYGESNWNRGLKSKAGMILKTFKFIWDFDDSDA